MPTCNSYARKNVEKQITISIHNQGSAVDGDLDKQGRTLIPAVLRKYAMLDKEVVFIGMGKRAEIWDKARWDEKNAEVELNIEDIASDMEASGFSI